MEGFSQGPSQGLQCEECGSTSFAQNDEGMMVCNDCGTISQQFREETADILMPGTAMRGYRASQGPDLDEELAAFRKSRKRKAYDLPVYSERETAIGIFTCAVCGQLEWLKSKMKISSKVEIFAKRILYDWVSAVEDFKAISYISLYPVAVIYLACVACREPVLPTDLENWIVNSDFPYGPKITPLLTHFRVTKRILQRHTSAILPNTLRIRLCVRRIVSTTGGVPCVFEHTSKLESLPVGNAHFTVWRYVHWLSLSRKVVSKALSLRDIRLSTIFELTNESDQALNDFVATHRPSPFVLCSELELMTDVIIAAILEDEANPQSEPATWTPAEARDLTAAELEHIRGPALFEHLRWFVENDRGSGNLPSAVREVEKVASFVSKRCEHLGPVSWLQPAVVQRLEQDSKPKLPLHIRALRLLRLGIDNAGSKERSPHVTWECVSIRRTGCDGSVSHMATSYLDIRIGKMIF